MKRYKVFVLPAARQNETEILRYLATISPATAKRYSRLFAEGFRSLAEFPLRFPLARNPYMAEKGYRYLLIKNYLVFFQVSDDDVEITHIIDGRSNYL